MGKRFVNKIAIAALLAFPAAANAIVITGTTAGGPTFNRTLEGEPPNGLSAVGTNVLYDVSRFTVSASGSYVFLNSSAYDNFLILYQNAFTAGSPLVNAVVAADDTIGTNAGFLAALTSGVTYYAVATSFFNGDGGAYSLFIDGPGTVATVVPEPETWALLMVGLGMVGVAARRRKREQASG